MGLGVRVRGLGGRGAGIDHFQQRRRASDASGFSLSCLNFGREKVRATLAEFAVEVVRFESFQLRKVRVQLKDFPLVVLKVEVFGSEKSE